MEIFAWRSDRGRRSLGVMKKALILLGHADPASFNRAVATAYQEGFRAAGGDASIVTLSDLRFDPVLRTGFRGDQALEPDLLELRARIEAADHLVWVFPTYWVSPPAIVRALVDRLFLPDWAFAYRPGKALPEGLLAGRSSRVLTTMDSPSWEPLPVANPARACFLSWGVSRWPRPSASARSSARRSGPRRRRRRRPPQSPSDPPRLPCTKPRP